VFEVGDHVVVKWSWGGPEVLDYNPTVIGFVNNPVPCASLTALFLAGNHYTTEQILSTPWYRVVYNTTLYDYDGRKLIKRLYPLSGVTINDYIAGFVLQGSCRVSSTPDQRKHFIHITGWTNEVGTGNKTYESQTQCILHDWIGYGQEHWFDNYMEGQTRSFNATDVPVTTYSDIVKPDEYKYEWTSFVPWGPFINEPEIDAIIPEWVKAADEEIYNSAAGPGAYSTDAEGVLTQWRMRLIKINSVPRSVWFYGYNETGFTEPVKYLQDTGYTISYEVFGHVHHYVLMIIGGDSV
jgi:hypothetical protein